MPKDSTAVIGEIENPILRQKVATERDRMRAERALDLAHEELKNAEAAAARLPAVEAELATVRRMLDRPQRLEASLKAPAQAKPAVKAPTALGTIALAVSAEIVRRLDGTDPADFIKQVRPGDEWRLVRRYAQKAATDPAYTNVAGWAQELTTTGLGPDFVDRAPSAVIPQLLGAGAREMNFRGHNAMSYPRRLRDTLPAAWKEEGTEIPVKAGMFGSVTLTRYSLGVIATLSEEIRRVSRPQIVDVVQQGIIDDSARALDGFFLDANVPVAGVRPAGILNGAASQVSAGNDVDSVQVDLKWLLGHLIGIRARRPVFIINPLRVASLSLTTAPGTGIRPYQAELERGTLAGVPLVIADNAPADQVIAMDADSLFMGIDIPEIDMSNQAVLTMSGDPANDSGTPVRSLFQTWEVALRFVQPASWGFGRPDTVATLTSVDW
ncbi:phage major capsid protein [Shimia aestuarii]|uniref:Phage major capsid protein, HK97 family n=1 Tax=Shimia aestuarii TaxID=254406 RepID=A0A1I4P1K4_9RHOB|nr:phage major capsid protein [Shimia aestuarii]SFM21681.1 phage major capsid protein, HK97 family [Shimia aestuarii]